MPRIDFAQVQILRDTGYSILVRFIHYSTDMLIEKSMLRDGSVERVGDYGFLATPAWFRAELMKRIVAERECNRTGADEAR
jgi:hypothetical protein